MATTRSFSSRSGSTASAFSVSDCPSPMNGTESEAKLS